jgi:heavy metal sensor kinase
VRSVLRHTRVRLTAAYVGLLAVLATAAAVAFWLALRSVDYVDIDATLRADAHDVASNVQDPTAGGGQPSVEDAGGLPAGTSVVMTDGRIVASFEPGLAPADAAMAARSHGPFAGTWVGDVRSQSVDLRVLIAPVAGTPDVVVIVTHPLAAVEHDLYMTAILLTEVVAGFVVLASGLGYWLAGRALRPVGVIAGIARDLSERDLHRRIDLSLPPDELGELAATFNSMLARLEKGFLALRNFTADAAHELRAPLTLMRAELETALRSGEGVVDRAVVCALVTETDRLGRIADQLLLMAQADAGRLTPERAVVDVADLVVERGDRWAPLAAAKDVQLVVRAPDSGTLAGDAELLGRLVDNLLDNAIRHTPEGGEVELAAHRAGDSWEFHVTDTGPGIAPDFRPRLFERFSRPEGARSRQGGGAGLGLALCAAIAVAHGGSIGLVDTAAGGAHFAVRVPAG